MERSFSVAVGANSAALLPPRFCVLCLLLFKSEFNKAGPVSDRIEIGVETKL